MQKHVNIGYWGHTAQSDVILYDPVISAVRKVLLHSLALFTLTVVDSYHEYIG